MKYFAVVVFTFWTTACLATGQIGELIIYNGDTLTMLSEPLESYLGNNEPRQRFHPFLENGCSTALWRGYVGLWRIQNGKLLLVDVYICGEKNISIKDLIFKDANTEIYAEWFTGDLFIEKGKMIKYYHSGYHRCYETEFVVSVSKGNIQAEKEYKNGIKTDDKRFPCDISKIIEEIYKRINWDKLPKLSNKKKIFVDLIINNGKIEITDFIIDKQDIEDIYKMEVKRVITDFPEVQIFYSRGKPLREDYYGTLIFSRQNKKRYKR